MARPTRIQSIINKLERNRQDIAENSSEIMMVLFKEVEAIALDKTATAASRMAAIKFIFDVGDKFKKEESGIKTDEDTVDDSQIQNKDYGGMPISKRLN